MTTLTTVEEITNFMTKGEFHKALSLYSEAITKEQKKDKNSKILYSLLCERASILLKVSLFDECMLDIKKAINIDETNTKAFEIQVELLLSTSKKEEAKSLLEDLTQKFKNSEVFKKKLETLNESTVQKEDPLCKMSNELDCGLCFRTYFEPITTPCGHTFCRECLARALDYAQKCPLCRAPIHCRPEVHPVTVIINDLVQKYKLDDYLERQKENEESKKMTTSNVPFFCLDYVLFPTSHLPLHIFEPKYRLMIRRCMEGGRCFGLVPIIDGEISKVGTIARIETLNVLPDGRSVIKTVGQERFKVLDVWEQDGYKMGKIEYFEESKEILEEKDTKPIIELASNLFNSFGDETQKSIQEKYGNFPDGSNVDHVVYWISSILPIANSSKMEILEEVSTKQKIKKLMGLANELMTSNSCSVM